MFRMQCGENSTQTAHTFVHISHTPGGPRFAHINGPLGAHTQSAQGRVRVSDALESGKGIRLLTIVDECTRESPAIEVDTSLGEFRVRRVLDRIALERGLLEAIVLDNGPFFGRNHLQFASRLRLRAHRRDVLFSLLRPEESRLRLPDFKRRNTPVLSGYGQPIP
jgi:transposase InsO family protein